MSRVYQEAKFAEKQSVLRSNVFQEEECSRKQTVLSGKVLRSKMYWGAKCPQGAKCFREQSVHQPDIVNTKQRTYTAWWILTHSTGPRTNLCIVLYSESCDQ